MTDLPQWAVEKAEQIENDLVEINGIEISWSCVWLNDGGKEAIARALADAATPKWQPIETAPRDREILIYSPEYDEQFVAFWGVCPDDGDSQWVVARSKDMVVIVRNPTHWLPLPAAPEVE